MEIPKNLKDEIWDYCRLNDISNIDEFQIKLLKQGFTAEKFGSSPVPTKEVIVEVIKEVEVEKEKIVYVDVVVEKVVEKEVIISDDKQVNELSDKITSLEEELKKEISGRFASERFRKEDGMSHINESILLNEQITNLKKELAEEKLKNKKDIYGE
jgi:hypothetical protein